MLGKWIMFKIILQKHLSGDPYALALGYGSEDHRSYPHSHQVEAPRPRRSSALSHPAPHTRHRANLSLGEGTSPKMRSASTADLLSGFSFIWSSLCLDLSEFFVKASSYWRRVNSILFDVCGSVNLPHSQESSSQSSD